MKKLRFPIDVHYAVSSTLAYILDRTAAVQAPRLPRGVFSDSRNEALYLAQYYPEHYRDI
jgi:hypothetical protein